MPHPSTIASRGTCACMKGLGCATSSRERSPHPLVRCTLSSIWRLDAEGARLDAVAGPHGWYRHHERLREPLIRRRHRASAEGAPATLCENSAPPCTHRRERALGRGAAVVEVETLAVDGAASACGSVSKASPRCERRSMNDFRGFQRLPHAWSTMQVGLQTPLYLPLRLAHSLGLWAGGATC